jgi:hypothetical protein
MAKLMAFLLAALSSLPLSSTAEETSTYRPLYAVDIPFDPAAKGTILSDYMYAYNSKTTEEALKRWEAFSRTHLEDPDTEIDDLTALTLLRQAAYELARLYYLTGSARRGDEQLLKAENLVVYTMPNKEQGRTWCQSNGFCKQMLPNYLLQPTPKSGAAEQ